MDKISRNKHTQFSVGKTLKRGKKKTTTTSTNIMQYMKKVWEYQGRPIACANRPSAQGPEILEGPNIEAQPFTQKKNKRRLLISTGIAL